MRQVRCLLTGFRGGLQELLPRLLIPEVHQRAFRFLQRRQNRALVEGQRGFRAGVGGFNARMNAAQIQRGPGDARTEIPCVCAAFAQPGERVRLKTHAPDECDTRKQVRRCDADSGRRSRE